MYAANHIIDKHGATLLTDSKVEMDINNSSEGDIDHHRDN